MTDEHVAADAECAEQLDALRTRYWEWSILAGSAAEKDSLERGGERSSTTNLQWVTLRINVMKSDLTHDEFLFVVGIIASRFPTLPNSVIPVIPPYRWGTRS